MNIPKRIQRLRVAHTTHPRWTLHASRPSGFGNPFTSAAAFLVWLETGRVDWEQRIPSLIQSVRHMVPPGEKVEVEVGGARWFEFRREWILANLDRVRGATHISCWCPLNQECHVDVLIAIAFRTGELS